MLTGRGRKRKGSHRELQLIHYLEENGYSCTHSGGSLGAWDIIAIPVGDNSKRRDVLMVQLKSNRPPDRKERVLLAEFMEPACCCKMIVVAPDGTTPKDWLCYTNFQPDALGLSTPMWQALVMLEV
jgi:hypothetical protein